MGQAIIEGWGKVDWGVLATCIEEQTEGYKYVRKKCTLILSECCIKHTFEKELCNIIGLLCTHKDRVMHYCSILTACAIIITPLRMRKLCSAIINILAFPPPLITVHHVRCDWGRIILYPTSETQNAANSTACAHQHLYGIQPEETSLALTSAPQLRLPAKPTQYEVPGNFKKPFVNGVYVLPTATSNTGKRTPKVMVLAVQCLTREL